MGHLVACLLQVPALLPVHVDKLAQIVALCVASRGLCHMDKVSQPGNILIRIFVLHIKSRFRTLSVSKYFDKTSQYSPKKEAFWGRISKKTKNVMMAVAKLPWSIFLTFLRNWAETAQAEGSPSRYLEQVSKS